MARPLDDSGGIFRRLGLFKFCAMNMSAPWRRAPAPLTCPC